MMNVCLISNWPLCIIRVAITMHRGWVASNSADIWTLLEDHFTHSEKFCFINMSIMVDICLFENKEKLSRVVSSIISNSLEKIIEEPMQFSRLHFVGVINIIPSPYFINILLKSLIVHLFNCIWYFYMYLNSGYWFKISKMQLHHKQASIIIQNHFFILKSLLSHYSFLSFQQNP